MLVFIIVLSRAHGAVKGRWRDGGLKNKLYTMKDARVRVIRKVEGVQEGLKAGKYGGVIKVRG